MDQSTDEHDNEGGTTTMSEYDRYNKLKGHLEHHGLRKWLITWAIREDANTIRRAIERLSDDQLVRRIARALAKQP